MPPVRVETLGIPPVVSVLREFPEEGVEILSQTAPILNHKREEAVSVSRTEVGVFADLFLRCPLCCRSSSVGCLRHVAGRRVRTSPGLDNKRT